MSSRAAGRYAPKKAPPKKAAPPPKEPTPPPPKEPTPPPPPPPEKKKFFDSDDDFSDLSTDDSDLDEEEKAERRRRRRKGPINLGIDLSDLKNAFKEDADRRSEVRKGYDPEAFKREILIRQSKEKSEIENTPLEASADVYRGDDAGDEVLEALMAVSKNKKMFESGRSESQDGDAKKDKMEGIMKEIAESRQQLQAQESQNDEDGVDVINEELQALRDRAHKTRELWASGQVVQQKDEEDTGDNVDPNVVKSGQKVEDVRTSSKGASKLASKFEKKIKKVEKSAKAVREKTTKLKKDDKSDQPA